MKAARGYYGARHTQYRSARSAVMRAQAYSFIGRRLKKRDFRALWIARINAACHMNDISYSRFMFGLKSAGIELNRKVLADIAVNDMTGFAKLVAEANKGLKKAEKKAAPKKAAKANEPAEPAENTEA